jgi:hypothetical protein
VRRRPAERRGQASFAALRGDTAGAARGRFIDVTGIVKRSSVALLPSFEGNRTIHAAKEGRSAAYPSASPRKKTAG